MTTEIFMRANHDCTAAATVGRCSADGLMADADHFKRKRSFTGLYIGNWQDLRCRVCPTWLVAGSAGRLRGGCNFIGSDRTTDLAGRLGNRRRPRDLLFSGHQATPAVLGDRQHRSGQDRGRQPARAFPSVVLFPEGHGILGLGTRRPSLVCLPRRGVRVFPWGGLVGHRPFPGIAAVRSLHGARCICEVLGRGVGGSGPPKSTRCRPRA